MIYRRFIPPITALTVLIAALLPVWLGVSADVRANQFTLSLVSVTSMALAALFWWMRHRMGNGRDGRTLTIFGIALRDLFASLITYFVVKAVFWAIFAWASWQRVTLDRWQVIGLRAALASSAALVIGSAFGAAWEMGRARTGPRMVVHVPAELADRDVYEGVERRGPEPGRRVTDR